MENNVKLLCPSMMCANFANLEQEIQVLESAGADIFHVDIMDGRFVPNFGMGLQDLSFIAGATARPVDVHLMIENPGAYVKLFAGAGASIVYIHPEADVHAPRTLASIRDAGAAPGIAINPGTSVETVMELLSLVDYVLVMTVNPGFAGQTYLDFVDRKLERLIALKCGYKLLIDGACSPDRIHRLSRKGVDGFVLGTSALFGKGRPYRDIINELRDERGDHHSILRES